MCDVKVFVGNKETKKAQFNQKPKIKSTYFLKITKKEPGNPLVKEITAPSLPILLNQLKLFTPTLAELNVDKGTIHNGWNHSQTTGKINRNHTLNKSDYSTVKEQIKDVLNAIKTKNPVKEFIET
ncbi:MAG: hypothetical protein ACJAV6_000056 [Candidatus Paceibacteria bacterium]|jgi:hypothetical protein